jgi:hypothetical protein
MRSAASDGFLTGLSPDARSAHLNFDTIHGFKTASSQYYAKQMLPCVSPRAKNWKRPTFIPLIFFYMRMRKEKYSAKVRKALKRKVLNLARKREVFVYFKHEEAPEGALHAEELL